MLKEALVRGYLLRRQLHAVRAEYEAVVLETEGSLERLRWTGQRLLRPVFVESWEAPHRSPPRHNKGYAAEKPLEAKRAATQEPLSVDESNTDTLQQESPLPEASEPARDQGCSSNVKPPAELRSEGVTSEGDEARPDAGAGTGRPAAKGHSAPAEGEEGESKGCEASAWASTVLESTGPGAGLEIPLEDLKELPRTVPGLLAYRNHLIMELLWLQQAIVSRKNYLRLKKKLGAPGL
ncbi:IQ domain-containing protein C [Nothoprocta perdicaria]|uniref:IQ domain-containing protein C n=1 Tax=Nothoprocta perdicaria TaxID=30464 RepID=UPI000E1BD3DD|nr:IQ domain-containing protein C [Nothoprocta perdicaria]